jgi:hypothetical protein
MGARECLQAVLAAAFLLPACSGPERAAERAPAAEKAVGYGFTTPNTVRVTGPSRFAGATAITQLTYGSTHHEDRPHAVTLVRIDRQADAMLAASRITHFPVNAPVLYVEAERIPDETRAELIRLRPDGNTYDASVQVYLVGPIGSAVRREIESLGFEARAFDVGDPFTLSEVLDRWAAAVHADHPDEVAIVQYQQLDTGLPSVSWNAHMGHGLFFVDGDTVPEATRRGLSRRFGGEAFMYVFGDESVVPASVERELARYGHVQRVNGPDAETISVTFAGYRDAGLNQGYWLGSSRRDFGWGIAEAGHNFVFADPDDWPLAVTGSLLAHMGKHGPLIVLPGGQPTEVTRRYLELVRPRGRAVHDALHNHGWVLGGVDSISAAVQAELDLLLDE